MATGSSPSDRILSSSASLEVADALQKLSLDAQNNSLLVPDTRNKDFVDPSMFYNPNSYPSSTYYYGAYDGSANEWERYSTPDGAEKGVYGEYHGYSYAPYGAYPPSASSMGHEGQFYGPQQYQYPTSYFRPSTPISASHMPKQTDASLPIAAEKVQSQAETANGNMASVGHITVNRSNLSKPVRPYNQNFTMKFSDPYGWGGLPSGISSAVSHGYGLSSGRNQNHLVGLQHPRATPGLGPAGYMNQLYPNHRIYGQFASTFGGADRVAPNSYDPRMNNRGWLAVDNKYRSKGRGISSSGNSNGNMDGFNELNRGPRAKGSNELKDSEPITLAVKGQSLPLKGNDKENVLPFPENLPYNKDDFPETFVNAKFFVIKSYSEDDVHKSIKYGVWASTPNGNKKLDAAYKEAQEKSGGCPVFLLFSVNASGQFVGLAEMVGPVDFERSVEYWQQDKWSGCFPVKWHIVKDVPNSLLRHITLENNENKPVTNSRDAQEVGLEQGIEIIKIFKGHSSKTCILDDFEFYEGREKTMVEKKAKQRQLQVASIEILDAALTEDVDKNGLVGSQTAN